jgi:hypothetical protein
MKMIKTVNLLFEDARMEGEYNSDTDLVMIQMSDFVLDKEESKPGHEVFKENRKVEVFTTVEETKEIIKALQEVLPEGEEE